MRPRTYVDRDPSTSGTSSPPESAMYERTPARAGPSFTTSPAFSAIVAQRGACAPFTVTGMSAPVTAMAPGASTSNRGPISVHSSAAAPSGLPTSRLASTNAKRSTGPDGGMPYRIWPVRPRSWTVV